MAKTTTTATREMAAARKKKKTVQCKGVRMRSWGSWVSEIRAPNHKARIWLGSYSTPEAASRAYNAALQCLNSPSLSPKSIQRIAAAAANVDATALSPPPPPTDSSTSQPPPENWDWWPEVEAFWSPKCMDWTSECSTFGLAATEEIEEEYGDGSELRLWSFC